MAGRLVAAFAGRIVHFHQSNLYARSWNPISKTICNYSTSFSPYAGRFFKTTTNFRFVPSNFYRTLASDAPATAVVPPPCAVNESDQSPSFFRRPLPQHLVSFSSSEGKTIFREALADSYMESKYCLFLSQLTFKTVQ